MPCELISGAKHFRDVDRSKAKAYLNHLGIFILGFTMYAATLRFDVEEEHAYGRV